MSHLIYGAGIKELIHMMMRERKHKGKDNSVAKAYTFEYYNFCTIWNYIFADRICEGRFDICAVPFQTAVVPYLLGMIIDSYIYFIICSLIYVHPHAKLYTLLQHVQ